MVSRKLARPDLSEPVPYPLGHGGEPELRNVKSRPRGPGVISRTICLCWGHEEGRRGSALDPE